MNTVRQFYYLEVSISQFEKTPVKVHGLLLANSHVFTEFEDSEDSPKWAFLHLCCYDVGSGTSMVAYMCMHMDIPQWHFNQLSDIVKFIT